MVLDFSKVFGVSLRYPFERNAYLLFFAVNIVFAIGGWFLTGYFIGDMTDLETIPALEQMIPFVAYVLPLVIASWLATLFLMPAYFENAAHFYRGKRKAISEGFALSKKRFVSMFALFLILGLIQLACLGGFLLTLLSIPLLSSPEGLAILSAAAIWVIAGSVAGAVVIFTTFLSPVFCALEKAKPLEAIRKSWGAVLKNKANTLLFFVIFIVMFFGITIIGSMPESVYYILAGQPSSLSVTSFLFMLLRAAVSTYTSLFAYASLVSYYTGIKKTKD